MGEEARTEPFYVSARASEYTAPPVENLIPIPIPAPYHPCSSSLTCPDLEEIVEEPRDAICDDLDALLREVDAKSVRDLQEESSNSLVCSPPQVGSERWKRLNGIHMMHPGPGRREQRATHSHPYIRRDSSICPAMLWDSGEPGRHSPSLPSPILGTINLSVLWRTGQLPASGSQQSGLVFQAEELVWMPGGELGLWICNPPEGQLD